MTGRRFEDYVVKTLHKNGFWAHRISPDESGQQPFDVVAVRGIEVCAYDAKVISEGHRFVMNRLEDNQWNAFQLFDKKVYAKQIGLLIYCEDKIRYMDIDRIRTAVQMHTKSIDVHDLPEWVI